MVQEGECKPKATADWKPHNLKMMSYHDPSQDYCLNLKVISTQVEQPSSTIQAT